MNFEKYKKNNKCERADLIVINLSNKLFQFGGVALKKIDESHTSAIVFTLVIYKYS